MGADYEQTAAGLRAKCDQANSETTIAARIEAILHDLLRERGIEYEPVREKRVIKRGRIDSQFGAVITEYKMELRTHDD